jgi:hypothetical protein
MDFFWGFLIKSRILLELYFCYMGKRVPIGVIKTRGVILYEDKIFLCKFDPSVYGAPMSSSFFGLPGGTLDPKETLKA